jgi:hypothetical protein
MYTQLMKDIYGYAHRERKTCVLGSVACTLQMATHVTISRIYDKCEAASTVQPSLQIPW